MALFAIGDTHLSLGGAKPMDVFGGTWENYVEKLRRGFEAVRTEDTVVLVGDLSWGMSLEEALPDFQFLNALPGEKYLVKGNHDYWWTTANKMRTFWAEHGLTTLHLLHNSCAFYGDVALCGTRGWFFDQAQAVAEADKVYRRELMRLETSLRAAGDTPVKLAFLHYPPLYQGYICREIVELLEKYRVARCFYGHLHGPAHKLAIEGWLGGVDYRLVSADYLDFAPEKILE